VLRGHVPGNRTCGDGMFALKEMSGLSGCEVISNERLVLIGKGMEAILMECLSQKSTFKTNYYHFQV